MNEQQPLVCWFKECGKDSVPLVGGKNASLGVLINAGVRVPPGYAVTTNAYKTFIEKGGVDVQIEDLLKDLNTEDTDALNLASSRIRELIESTSFSTEMEDFISEYYRKLSKRCYLPATPVAVRSSATAEDLPGASFAGQQDTFLWIRGADDVLRHVRRCFSSLFTPRAIAYRVKMGFDHSQVYISVGVQKMAKSFTAGVMFTLNPHNGDRSQIVIDSNFGFGESVVSGEVTPDHFRVDKVTMDILERTISKKDIYYTVDPVDQRTKRMALSSDRSRAQSIIDEDIVELAKMGKAIEKVYGRPMDIEWAVEKSMAGTGNVFILQSRPETVWGSKKKEPEQGGQKKTAMDHILASIMTGKKLQ